MRLFQIKSLDKPPRAYDQLTIMSGARPHLRPLGKPEWRCELASLYCVPNDSIFGRRRHRHSDYYQVTKVLEGQGEVVIGKHRFAGDAGGVFWVPPNTW